MTEEQKPLELEDTLSEMIDFCLKVSDSSQTLLSTDVNPIKLRINKFREIFESKRNKPNNMKAMVSNAYSKCSKKIDQLENNVKSTHEFLKWFGDQSISLQPRDDPKSVSIPLSVICRNCLKMGDEEDDHAALADIFLLHLLRNFAFATTNDTSEEKIDDHISYLEGMLGLDPDETPDITGFVINMMDKLSARMGGGKDMMNTVKKFMRGPLKREDRRKYEDTILKVTDKFISAIPKDAMTNPENLNIGEVMASATSNFQSLQNDSDVRSIFDSLSLPTANS